MKEWSRRSAGVQECKVGQFHSAPRLLVPAWRCELVASHRSGPVGLLSNRGRRHLRSLCALCVVGFAGSDRAW